MESHLTVAEEVRDALAGGGAVVALETSVVVQGLPAPDNLAAARRCAAAVREAGAVPAFVALLGGRATIGATEAELERLAGRAGRAAKAGVRDLAALMAARADAGTTVSATCALAARAGIRLFATGGIGGVHRRGPSAAEPLDVSSDLTALARHPVCVVSAGPKVVLDVPATAEWLETAGVPVLGWRTSELPAFFVAEGGVPLEHRVEDAGQAAAVLRIQWEELGRREGLLLCVAPPEPLPRHEVEEALATAMAEAAAAGLAGKAVTPALLRVLDRCTGGRTRRANLALLEANARVAGQVAAALARPH